MFIRAWRLRRYRRLLENSSLVVTDSETITSELEKLWRCLKPEDLFPITTEYRTQQHVAVCYPNLPALVAALKNQNQLIADEADAQLERRLGQDGRDTKVVSLDFYLADDQHLPIDEVQLFNRLRGLIQAHHCLVTRHTGHFYERHSEMIYKDLVTLIHVLINSIQS